MATFDVAFACESMDADACTKMLYLANRVLSAAISTSMILPLAASKVDFVRFDCSRAKLSLETVPPFSARRVAMFSIA